MNLTYENIPIEIEIKGYQPRVSGNYSGSNENCFPEEPEEFEFEIMDIESPNILAKNWQKLGQAEREILDDKVMLSIRLKNNDLSEQERGEIEQLILNKREKNHD